MNVRLLAAVLMAVAACGPASVPADAAFAEVDGVVLTPDPPYELVVRPGDFVGINPAAGVDDVNEQLYPPGPAAAFETFVLVEDAELWAELDAADPLDRDGFVLLEASHGGDDAVAHWDPDGRIASGRVAVDVDLPMDERLTGLAHVRDYSMRGLGVVLGLAADPSGIGSCMAEPPDWKCNITLADRERLRDAIGDRP